MGDQLLDRNAWRNSIQRPVTADDINSSHAKNGAYCTAHPKEKNCDLLEPAQRTSLINETFAAMGTAYAAYLSAITQVRVDELLKKPEDVSILGALVLEALGGVAGMALSKAIKGLRVIPDATVPTFLSIGVDRVGVDSLELAAANESNVNRLINAATSVANQGVRTGVVAARSEIKAHRGQEITEDQAVANTFASQLEIGGAMYFEDLRKNVIGSLNDADMILFYRSWDAVGHTVPVYKAQIENKLARYRASNASKIGRKEAGRHLAPAPKGADMGEVGEHALREAENKDVESSKDIRDTKLVMHVFDNGVRPTLYYYKRDYHGGMQNAPGGQQFMDPTTNLDELAREGWEMYGEVESDLVEAAQATNEKAWGVKFEPKIIHAPSYGRAAPKPSTSAPAPKPAAPKPVASPTPNAPASSTSTPPDPTTNAPAQNAATPKLINPFAMFAD